jgi:ABC-type nitrate/sulfonate/bicarbonate transport system substrate-binding protein
MRTRVTAVITMAVVAAIVAACGSSSSASHGSATTQASAAAHTAAATSGASVLMGHFLGPYMVDVAQREHLTTNLRLHLATLASGSAALPLMLSGRMDGVTDIGVPPLVTAAAQHVPLRIVWYAGNDPAGIYVKPQIKTAKELAGQNLAAPAGSIAQIALAEYLNQQGVGYSSVHFVNLPPGSIVASYKTGQIAGASIWTPVTTGLHAAGAKLMANQPETAFTVFSSSFVSKHPGAVQAYLCDIAGAQDLRRSNPARVYADLAPAEGTSAKGVEAEMPTNPPSDQTAAEVMGTTGHPPAGQVSQIVDAGQTMAKLGVIPKAPDASSVRSMFDPQFAEYIAAGKCPK